MKKQSIPLSEREGSWVLDNYVIVVSKVGFDIPNAYYVEISSFLTHSVVRAGNYTSIGVTPYQAALAMLTFGYGPHSSEVAEFKATYPQKTEKADGWRMDDDLDGASVNVPACRRGRVGRVRVRPLGRLDDISASMPAWIRR